MKVVEERLMSASCGARSMLCKVRDGKEKHISLGDYAKGKTVPTAASMREICLQTGVSADWLLGMSDEREHGAVTTTSVPNLYRMMVLLDPFDTDKGRAQKVFRTQKKPESIMQTLKRNCERNRSGGTHMRTIAQICEAYGLTIDFALGIGGNKRPGAAVKTDGSEV